MLLTFLYKMAREREGVFEVTVEDPAPGFEKVYHIILAPIFGCRELAASRTRTRDWSSAILIEDSENLRVVGKIIKM